MARRSLFVLMLCWAMLVCSREAQAQPEGQPCEAEPTDQLIAYGDHIYPCQIDVDGDSDLYRFQGSAGEDVTIRVTDQAGQTSTPSCLLELIGPTGGPIASVADSARCEIRTTLDVSGLFTVRVTEYGNNQVMTYAAELDRLVPPSTTAVSINPGDTITGGTIDPRGDSDLYIFNGVSGDTISLRLTDQAGPTSHPSCLLELYRPDGTLVSALANSTICALDVQLDQTGVFTIRTIEYGEDDLMTYNLEYQCIIGSCPTFHPLTIARTGAGTVTSTTPGINCGVDCWERYFTGTMVTLAATPDSGWTFSGWSGDPDCADGSVTMTASRSCIATFLSGSAAPTTVDDAFSTPPNTQLTVPAPGVLANDNTNGGGTMTAVLETSVSHGFLALNTNGGFTYTPAAGFIGTDSFVYRASNANGVGNTATVTLTVTALPPPTAVDDAYSVTANTTLNVSPAGVLGNDISNGSGAMSAVLVATTSQGSLVLNVNGGFSYVPALDFVGTDTFTYRAANAGGTSNIATATVTVAHPTTPQPPRQLVVDSVAGQLVTLRFTAPPIGPAPTGFVLKGGVLPGQVLAAIPTGSSAPIFTFVAPTGSFHIRMHTMAGADESGPSNEVPLHVNVPVPPSAPAHLIGTVSGSSLALAWKNTFQGGPPSDLVLDVSGSYTGSFSLGVTDRFDFPAVPGGTYTLSVRAVNVGGSSPSSSAVTFGFPAACSGAPAPPANFLAYRLGSTIFAVWDPPTSGPAPTGYVLNVTGAFTGTVPTTGRMLTGSAGPGSYGLSVQATSPCGSSAFTPVQVMSIP